MARSRYANAPIRAARRARVMTLEHRYITVLRCEHGRMLFDLLKQAYIFVTEPKAQQLELDL